MIATTFSISHPIQPHPDDRFAITFAPLSLEDVYAQADDVANGAIVVMSGMVRNKTDGKAVEFLEYQAYEPMAMRVFQQIAAEIRQTWTDVNRVVIHHRVGKLPIGQISVLIAVGCPTDRRLLRRVSLRSTPSSTTPRFGKKNFIESKTEFYRAVG